MPSPRPSTPATRYDSRKILSLIIIPIYILVIALLYGIGGTATYPQPFALLLLNVAFLGLIPIYIAYVSFVSFRRSGLASLLMMGAGMLFIGLGAVAAGLVGLLPGAANLVVTVHNTSTCIGAALQFAGALAALVGWSVGPAERRPSLAVSAYAVVVAVTAGLVLAALLGLTPTFFAPVTGATVLRTLVLTGAIASLLVASILFFVLYRKRHEDFFFWYAIGMALIGLGLIGVSFYSVFDDPLNWAARIEQYIGACFLLVAFLVLQRRATSGRVPAREMLARFFVDAEAGYRQLIETAGDAIIVLDSARRVLLWNAAAGELFGYTSDEAVGMSFAELVPASEEEPADGDAGPVHRESEARRLDGETVPIEIATSRRIIDGEPITTCIIRDLSERKAAELELARYAEDLRESRQQLADVIDASGAGYYHFAVDGSHGSISSRGAEILGFPPEELPPFPKFATWIQARIHPDDLGPALGSFAAFAAGEIERAEADVRVLARDGVYRWVQAISTAVLRDDAGRVVTIGGFLFDIDERKRAAEALQRSNEELQRFAYVASHDLQEPLRSIVSFSQLLERRYKGRLDQDADEFIGFIIEGGTRMQALIRDLLQVSRVETAAKSLEPTDAGAVVGAALRLLETPIGEAGGAVTVGPMPRVMADAAQFEQVFVNLVGNALKYRRPGVVLEVRISAERRGDAWEFAVADNGIGIEEQYFDRIFEMFRRLHTQDQYEGTGIGLAVVKRIVDRHGGRIRVESTPGEGSTFFFTLPAV
jgi:PAS domain S-box-containing protein